MNKQNRNIINERIKSYSTFTALVILLQQKDASAEILYSDIEPDIVLEFDLETYFVDIDTNGTIDFGFLNFSYYTYGGVSSSSNYLRQRLWAIATNGNSFIGIVNTFASVNRYYPLPLEYGALISNAQEFHSNYYQRMAFRSYVSVWTGSGSELVQASEGGYWYPEIEDGYLGIRFRDLEDKLHYGWIRCSVENEGRKLTIKDYAYEVNPFTNVFAGDTIGDTTSATTPGTNTIDATIYSFNNSVFIQLGEQIGNANVIISDMHGRSIYKEDILTSFTQIELKISKGYYIAEVQAGSGRLQKIIYIN